MGLLVTEIVGGVSLWGYVPAVPFTRLAPYTEDSVVLASETRLAAITLFNVRLVMTGRVSLLHDATGRFAFLGRTNNVLGPVKNYLKK